MILRLTDGTNTTNLVGGPVFRAEYVPRGPELSAVEFAPATILDGGEAAAITRRNVTEQCDVTIAADTTAEVEAALHEIEAFFMRAIEFQNRRGGSRGWVEYSSDDERIYRSEILYGRVELGEKPLFWLTGGPALSAALIWRRRFYWEAEEVALTLTNQHGATESGLAIYNSATDSEDNFVAIDGDDVTGVLPAPARIEIVNRYGTGILGNVIIGHNVYADPSSLAPQLEGENAGTVVGSVMRDAACSEGEYLEVDLTASQAQLAKWSLDSVSHFRGRFFRLFLRLQAAPAAGTYVQAKALVSTPGFMSPVPPDDSADVMAEGQESQLDTGQLLQDLGVLQIPPYLMNDAGTFYSMKLALYGRRESEGVLGLDFLYLLPLDSYRELRSRMHGIKENITLIDDGIADSIWAEGYGAGTERIGFYYGLGPRVMLVPGVDQRLYFLMTNTAGGCEIDRTADVVVKYRPRRVTV